MLSQLKLINFGTWRLLVLPLLSGIATAWCWQQDITYVMTVPASVFFVGIFFCFSVVLNTADQRRFRAFDEIALIKANLLALAHLSRNLDLDSGQKNRLKKDSIEFLLALKKFLTSPLSQESFNKVDKLLLQLTGATKVFRQNKLTPPEISRVEQWCAQINYAFENLLVIKEFRTLRSLRVFLKIALSVSVLVLAPEFARLEMFGVFIASFVALLLMSLIVIQEKIEHPFDQDLDNISLDFIKRFEARLND